MKMTLIAVSAALTLCSSLAWADSSTFQNSCRNIKMNYSEDGVRISAQCRMRNGNYNATSYMMRSLINDNGRLRTKSGRSTSFQHSCRNIGFSANANKVSISAICKTRSGSENKTSVEVYNIENHNGRLVYASR